jgi:hypothetical protein
VGRAVGHVRRRRGGQVPGLPCGGERLPAHRQTASFAGGHIKARHGRINGWLLVVYFVLFVWALYYGYTYWGGLGPGLDLAR